MKKQNNHNNGTENKYFKELTNKYYNDVFKTIGIDVDLECIYPKEFKQLEETTFIPDFMGKNKDDTIDLIQFQSRLPSVKQLYEIIDYISIQLVKNGIIVNPCIICTMADENMVIKVPITTKDKIHIPILALKEVDGDEIINNIKKKVENNEKLNREDEVFLSTIPFTNLKMSIDDAMIMAIDLTNKSTTIDENKLKIIKKLQSTISKKVVSEKTKREL